MIKQEDTQFKVIALQSAQGDLEKAKEIYTWLTSDEVKAEVEKQTQIIQQAMRDEWKLQEQLELFTKEANDAE